IPVASTTWAPLGTAASLPTAVMTPSHTTTLAPLSVPPLTVMTLACVNAYDPRGHCAPAQSARPAMIPAISVLILPHFQPSTAPMDLPSLAPLPSDWLPARIPLGNEIRIQQIAHRPNHRGYRFRHEVKVQVGDIVIRAMIHRLQAEGRDGLRHHPCARDLKVVGAAKEVLARVGVADNLGALGGHMRAQIAPLPAGQPNRVRRHSGIGPADHLELEIGEEMVERDGRMRGEIAGAESAILLAAEKGDVHRPFGLRAEREHARHFEHGGAAGGVVIGAVEDVIAVVGPAGIDA